MKRIINVETEISTVLPINSTGHDSKIETPLQICFEKYTLSIYSKWSISGSSSIRMQDLNENIIKDITLENETLVFKLGNSIELKVDLSESGYTGPEAMVLYGPEDSIIAWT